MEIMRIVRIFSVLTVLLALATINVDAQCKAFAKKECLPLLAPYTHDGNYHAAVLVEGELQSRTFKTEKGDSKTIVEIKARRIQFLNKRSGASESAPIEEHEDAPTTFEDDTFEKHLSPEDTALLEGSSDK